MGYLGLGEPGLGTCIIFAGVWINRNTTVKELTSSIRRYSPFHKSPPHVVLHGTAEPDLSATANISKRRYSNTTPPPSRWQNRELRFLGYTQAVQSPNTAVWQNTIPSRIFHAFPFLMEVMYWALIYSVYQFARSRLALSLTPHTITSSRHHALQLIALERYLHLFLEPGIQRFFLQYDAVMWWINRIYSYVHLPATISFLVGLYWFCVTRTRSRSNLEGMAWQNGSGRKTVDARIYEARRRALAVCNLLAFIVFSTWPCMPPRLLDDKDGGAVEGEVQRKFGFVDTVHARNGAVSVWNQRRFTNQLAAMPSLHFGYALMVGLTLITLPLDCSSTHSHSRTRRCTWCSWQCTFLRTFGFLYPTIILIAIIATANHFILDAVAGAVICGVAWHWNGVMLNLLPLEDAVLWCLRVHKPSNSISEIESLPY